MITSYAVELPDERCTVIGSGRDVGCRPVNALPPVTGWLDHEVTPSQEERRDRTVKADHR